MAEIIFSYHKTNLTISCQDSEKLEKIIKKFKDKLNIDNLIFLYRGNKIDENLTFRETINEYDKIFNKMKILVYDDYEINYILAEIYVVEIDEDIRIINSFENWKRINNEKAIKEFDNYSYLNEEEIKKKCEIYIDNKIIPFNYFFRFGQKGIHKIKYSFKNYITKIDYIFADCENLINIDLSNFKSEYIKNMSHMFYNCKSLEKINLCNFITNNTNNMSYMFYGCESLINLDLISFDTKLVNNMSYMFGNCSSLYNLDLLCFNTSNTDNMNGLFFGCTSLSNLYIASFNTGNLKSMREMFCGCNSLITLDLSNFNIKNVTDIHGLFSGCCSITSLDLSNFNIENVLDMGYLFAGCISLKNIVGISEWNTKKVTDINGLFYNCSSLKSLPNISHWNTNNVINMSKIFAGCSLIKSLPDISKWNTSKVTNMKEMFSECISLEFIPEISKWDTSNVIDISFMFFDCSSLIHIPNISFWKNDNIINMKGIFQGCSSASSIPDLSKWKCYIIENKINISKENPINNIKKLTLCNTLNTENIIKNDELKFLPQIEICFDIKKPFDLIHYIALRKEIKQTLEEEDFSIIEIRKGSLKMFITLQFLIFRELQKTNYFWLWESNAKNAIEKLDDKFDKTICNKLLDIVKKFRDKTFISLGKINPKYVDPNILKLSDPNIKQEIIRNIQNMVQDDFFKDLNLIEFAKYIEKKDLEQYFHILTGKSIDQERNQLKIMDRLDEFNKIFDIEIEKSLQNSIFEYKIIYIFLSDNKNLKNYEKEKKKCKNTEIKILLHGTSPKSVTSIISDIFNESSYTTFGRGVYFSNFLDYIWYYYDDKDKGIFDKPNIIPNINESFSFVASEVYYDSNKIREVYNNLLRNENVEKNGIRIAYADYNTTILSKNDIIENYNKFISKEFLISEKSQILPLYGVVAKRVEYLVIWRDYNLDLNNPNDYLDESFKQIKLFHKNIKKLLSKILNCKIYYVKTTEIALKLIDRKKYNKIIIITNGGNNGKEFIIEARKIIGSNAIAVISAIDIFTHTKNIQDMKNVLVLSGLEFHQKFFEAVLRNDIYLLEELKKEISKYYFDGTNFFKEFDGEVFYFPNFKNEGKFSDLTFNYSFVDNLKIDNFNRQNYQKDIEVVVGIYSDSDDSGFAYSFLDKNEIIHGSIYGASLNLKVPTEIILDNNNNIISFGYNCKKLLNFLGTEDLHYFTDIFKKESFKNKTTIEAKNSGKNLPLSLVIQRVFESIKELAIQQISKERPYLTNSIDKIKWVVTIPSYYDEYITNIMTKSCFDAGLFDGNIDITLFFVLEQEAILLYCYNYIKSEDLIKKGDNYIICNLGDKHGSIVTHSFGNNNLKSDLSFCEEKLGSNEIDKLIFRDIISKIFGCNDFNDYYIKYKELNFEFDVNEEELWDNWCELEREIKDFRESITIERVESKSVFMINCCLFQEILDEDNDINNLIENYNRNINDNSLKIIIKSRKKWIIGFPYKIIYNYMKIQAISFCNIINEINIEKKIKTMVFTGNQSNNEIITNLIKDELKENITHYLRVSNSNISILEGTVLFGKESLHLKENKN